MSPQISEKDRGRLIKASATAVSTHDALDNLLRSANLRPPPREKGTMERRAAIALGEISECQAKELISAIEAIHPSTRIRQDVSFGHAEPGSVRSEPTPEQGTVYFSAAESQMIFISHSSDDVEPAQALVECVEKSFHVPKSGITCTSVSGYQLSPGAHVSATLRERIRTCSVLIGLVSASSLSSGYVTMELGAAWVLEKTVIPFVLPGTTIEQAPGPVRDLHALHAPEGIYQLIDALEGAVDWEKRPSKAISKATTDYCSIYV